MYTTLCIYQNFMLQLLIYGLFDIVCVFEWCFSLMPLLTILSLYPGIPRMSFDFSNEMDPPPHKLENLVCNGFLIQ